MFLDWRLWLKQWQRTRKRTLNIRTFEQKYHESKSSRHRPRCRAELSWMVWADIHWISWVAANRAIFGAPTWLDVLLKAAPISSGNSHTNFLICSMWRRTTVFELWKCLFSRMLLRQWPSGVHVVEWSRRSWSNPSCMHSFEDLDSKMMSVAGITAKHMQCIHQPHCSSARW